MVNAVKTTAHSSEPMLTFQYKLQQQQQRTANLAVQGTKGRVTILAEGLSKSSAKELISSGKLNLPKSQLDKIMSTVNKASKSNSNITIKQVKRYN